MEGSPRLARGAFLAGAAAGGYVVSDPGDGSQAKSSRQRPRLRVLIVDDERDNLLSLGLLCREEGMEVRLLRDARAVETVMAEFGPDVILLDIVMPERNGLDVAEELSRLCGEERPLLVAITAYSSEADRRLAKAAGFHEFIAKPYDPQSLLRRLALLKPKR